MFECFWYIYNQIVFIIDCAMETKLCMFLLSLGIAVLFMCNIYSAKAIVRSMSSVAVGNNCNTPTPEVCDASTGAPPVSCRCEAREMSLTHYNYGMTHGPHRWKSPCSNQSPININTMHVTQFKMKELLTWNNYGQLPEAIMLENTGHTVILRASFTGCTPSISGGDLLSCYTFVEICFRWSWFEQDGSEHMLNYQKFPLEVQAMHRTGAVNNCASSYDLLSIAYFFSVSAENPYLSPLTDHLHLIRQAGTKIEIAPFPLEYLLYPFRENFYSYMGSLTEPPCYNGTEWFVYPERFAISERQLNEFRQLLDVSNTRILRNSRPVQHRGEREVHFNVLNTGEECDNNLYITETSC